MKENDYSLLGMSLGLFLGSLFSVHFILGWGWPKSFLDGVLAVILYFFIVVVLDTLQEGTKHE